MLFLDETKNITRENEIYKHILKINDNLEKIIEVQYAKRRTLTQVLDEIADIDDINMEDTKKLLSVIEDIRNILSRINDNIEGIKKIIEDISGIKERLDNIIDDNIQDDLLNKDLEYFYVLYIEKANIIEDTNLTYENIIIKAYEYMFLLASRLNDEKKSKEIINMLVNPEKIASLNTRTEENDSTHTDSNEQENPNTKEEQQEIKEDIQETMANEQEHLDVFKSFEIDSKEENTDANEETYLKNIDESKKDSISLKEEKNTINENNVVEKATLKKEENIKRVAENNKIKENNIEEKVKDNNVLIISQIQNKVFLPYKISEIKRKYNENPDRFSSIQDVISTEYVVPLNKYKNPIIARFKEAYNLMREKEDATFSESLDLALEVTFKSNLNPAVITACKDLNELDKYLDCLEENKLDKFKDFRVEYEGLPSLR